jgi:hypothetical protein
MIGVCTRLLVPRDIPAVKGQHWGTMKGNAGATSAAPAWVPMVA